MKECTFKPNLKPMSQSQMTARRSSRGTSRDALNQHSVDKCEELYMKAKLEFARNSHKEDKRTVDIEFEKAEAECTFKPKIKPLSRADLNISNYKPSFNAPDEPITSNRFV